MYQLRFDYRLKRYKEGEEESFCEFETAEELRRYCTERSSRSGQEDHEKNILDLYQELHDTPCAYKICGIPATHFFLLDMSTFKTKDDFLNANDELAKQIS